MGTGKLFARVMRLGILGAALLGAAALPAYGESDITLSGNAAFLTQYAKRGFTLSAERPAVQVEFDCDTCKTLWNGRAYLATRLRPELRPPKCTLCRLLIG